MTDLQTSRGRNFYVEVYSERLIWISNVSTFKFENQCIASVNEY